MIEEAAVLVGGLIGIGGTTLVTGALIGIGHSFEPDHVAAITTLINDGSNKSYPIARGALWGIGHSITVIAISLLLVIAGIHLPEQITALFGLLAGIVLLYLGIRMLIYAIRNNDSPHAVEGDGESHSHGQARTQLIKDGSGNGTSPQDITFEPLVVGIIHGFAGSGLIVIALVSTAQTLEATIAFLVGYSTLSIATMSAVSFLWGCALNSRIITYLRGGTGVVSLGVGVFLIVETLAGTNFLPL